MPGRAARPAGSVARRHAPAGIAQGIARETTLELFEAADLRVRRDSVVTYRADIDDPRIDEVRILRPQEIPQYVSRGSLRSRHHRPRLGRGDRQRRRVASASCSTPRPATTPCASSSRCRPTRPWQSVEDLRDGVRVSTEYPGLTARFFAEKGIEADIRLSYGATEAKVPDIVDCIVDLTETGRALRAAGLQDHRHDPGLVHRAGRQSGELRRPREAHAMHQVRTLLEGVLEARGKVLVKLNVAGDRLAKVIDLLPSMKSPTVNELYAGRATRSRPWCPRPPSTCSSRP